MLALWVEKVSEGDGGDAEGGEDRPVCHVEFWGRGVYGLWEGGLSLVVWDVVMVDVREVMHEMH